MAVAQQHRGKLPRLNLEGSALRYADVRDMKFRSVILRRAKLNNAIMTDANFSNADFRDADLTDAETTGTDFSGADLRGAKITLDQLARAIISPDTKLPGGITLALVAERARSKNIRYTALTPKPEISRV